MPINPRVANWLYRNNPDDPRLAGVPSFFGDPGQMPEAQPPLSLDQFDFPNFSSPAPEVPPEKVASPSSGPAAPAVVDDPGENGGGFKNSVAMALSGLGDAMMAQVGQRGRALPETTDTIEKNRETQLALDLRAQEQTRTQTEKEKRNVTARGLLSQLTGKPIETYKDMDADTIVHFAPLLKQYLEAPQKAQKEAEDKARQEELLGLRKKEVDLKEQELGRKQEKQDNFLTETMEKNFVQQLDKGRPEAEAGKNSLVMINKVNDLLKPGTTGVAGKVKAELAPFLQLFGKKGETWNSVDDAAKVQIMGRTVIGKMRLDLIGPGPVSEYEQKILSQLSGGGITPLAAAKELMAYYKDLAEKKVESYNATLTRAGRANPKFLSVYEPVTIEPIKKEGAGGLSPEKQKRLDFLRKKKAAGTLGGNS